MMARCVTLPDAITADDAATWPELLSTPVHLSIDDAAGILVETYFAQDPRGFDVPACAVSFMREGQPLAHAVLTRNQAAGVLHALTAALLQLDQAAAS